MLDNSNYKKYHVEGCLELEKCNFIPFDHTINIQDRTDMSTIDMAKILIHEKYLSKFNNRINRVIIDPLKFYIV